MTDANFKDISILCIFAVTPIVIYVVYAMTHHQQKMAALLNGGHSKDEEIASLREELRQTRVMLTERMDGLLMQLTDGRSRLPSASAPKELE